VADNRVWVILATKILDQATAEVLALRYTQVEMRYLDVLRDFPQTPAARMARARLQLLPPRAKDF